MRNLVVSAFLFFAGVFAGWFLFSSTLPRHPILLTDCGGRCIKPSELLGMLAAAGIQKTPAMLPGIVAETAECLAIHHPKPEGKVHFVLFPTRDVRNVGDLSAEDQRFVMGCLGLAGRMARDAKLSSYRLYTNGPGLQHVTYLHWHLVAK